MAVKYATSRLIEGKPPQELYDEGLCVNEPPYPPGLTIQDVTDPWFPDKEATAVGWPQKMCMECPVLETCAEYALESRERFGIWGGTTPADRRSIWRESSTLEEVWDRVRSSDE